MEGDEERKICPLCDHGTDGQGFKCCLCDGAGYV